MSDYGDFLNELLRRDLTGKGHHGRIEEFVEATKIKRNTVRNWINGTKIPLSALPEIASWFETTPSKLLSRQEETKSEPTLAEVASSIKRLERRLPKVKSTLSKDEADLLQAFRQLPPDLQESVIDNVKNSASKIKDLPDQETQSDAE